MTPKRLIVATVLLTLAGAVSLVAQSRSPEVQFKAAEQKELVQGDLRGAIADYERIAGGSDRALAAQALLRVAAIRTRLGEADARRVYERIIREFAEHTEAVRVARARLGGSVGDARAGKTKGPIPVTIEGLVFAQGISPDGRYISSRGTNGELVIKDLRTGQSRAVTGTATERGYEFANNPVFSRDGRRVAFMAGGPSLPQTEIRVIDLEERGVPRSRTIFSSNYVMPFGWTPDGQSLAVVAVPVRAEDAEFGVISVSNGSYRRLKRFAGGFTSMFVSPDGKYIAADLAPSGVQNSERDIFVIALEDARETRIEHPTDERVMGWSPDSRYLLFSSDRITGSPALYAQKVENGQPQDVPRLIDRDWGPVFPLGVGDSGALFYAPSPIDQATTATEIKIAAFDFARGEPLSAPRILREERPGSVFTPAWSPDGRQLAYGLMRPGRNQRDRASIVVRSIETGDSRELPVTVDLNNIRWHPDGRSLLATQQIGLGGDANIVRVDTSTGNVSAVAPGVNVTSSPDGATVYLRRPRTVDGKVVDVAIIARHLTSGSERELIRRMIGPGLWLSPDGQHIGVHTTRGAESRAMLVIPTGGGAIREVALPAVGLAFVAWAPDNRSLLFRTQDWSEMWRVSLDGMAARLEFDRAGWNQTGNVWAVHPDGKQIAFMSVASVGQRESGVWVLENFLSALDAK
jgi:Tol biopolymer transport system component